jgi:hypothetical protein
MMPDPSPTAAAEARTYLRRLGFVHSLAEGVKFAALAFVHPLVLLPVLISSLHAPAVFIAFAPLLVPLGERVTTRLSRSGYPLEATPRLRRLIGFSALLLLSGTLLSWGPRLPGAGLAALAMAAVFLGGGYGTMPWSAWLELTAATEGAVRSGAPLTARFLIGGIIGLIGGGIVRQVLEAFPSPHGWGLLQLIAGGLIALAYAGLIWLGPKITPDSGLVTTAVFPRNPRFLDALREAPADVRRMLLLQLLGAGFYSLAPFTAVVALDKLHQPPWYAGYGLTLFMAGWVLGTVLARRASSLPGVKSVLLVSRALMVAVSLLTVLSRTEWGLLAALGAMGAALAADQIATARGYLRVCPSRERFAVFSFVQNAAVLALAVAAVIAALLMSLSPSLAPRGLAAVLCVGLSIVPLVRLGAGPRIDVTAYPSPRRPAAGTTGQPREDARR